MADIIQRGLNLQVEAEDLASATFGAIADELDALQARAETVFGGLAMAGENAASSLSDAAQLFAPEWESQLEGLQGFADSVFAGMNESAALAADGMSGVAGNVSGAWSSALDVLQSSSDTAMGALDSLQGGMESTAGVADQTAQEIAGAYSGDALALDAAAGSLTGLQGDMRATAGVADTTAKEIGGAYSGDALALASGAGGLAGLQTDFNATATVGKDSAAAVKGAWGIDSLALDAGAGSLKDLQTQFNTTATDAESASEKIAKAFSGDGLALDAGAGALTDLKTQMGEVVTAARADATAIKEAWGSADLSAPAAGAAGAAGAVGGGEVAGVDFGKKGSAKAGSVLDGVPTPSLSGFLTGGITAAIGFGGVDLAIHEMESVKSFAAQTGLGYQQALEMMAASRGVGIPTEQLQSYIQRLDKNIGQLDQKAVLGAGGGLTAEGKPISMGFGREAVDPNTLKAVQTSLGAGGGGAAALALKTLGLGPDQLSGMDAQQQLGLIAKHLDEIKNATLRNAVATELFGRNPQIDYLLKEYNVAFSEAQKNLPKGLAQDLQTTLGFVGSKNMVDFQEQTFYLEVEMSASLMKMVPALDKILGVITQHTKLLEEIALGVLALAGAKKAAGIIDTIAGVAKHAPWAAGAAAGIDAAALAPILGPLGFAAAGQFLAKPDLHGTNVRYDAKTKQWEQLVNVMGQGRGAPMRQQWQHISSAAARKDIKGGAGILGINPDEIIEEDVLKKIGAPTSMANLALMNAWAQKEGMPASELNPLATTRGERGARSVNTVGVKEYASIATAVDALAKTLEQRNFSGITKGLRSGNPMDVLSQTKELGVWSGGNGAAYAQAIAEIFSKGEAVAKEQAPKLRERLDAAFAQIVDSARSHGVEFTAAEAAGITAAEAAIRQHAPNLEVPVTASLAQLVAQARAHGVEFTAAETQAISEAEAMIRGHAANMRVPITTELAQRVADAKLHGAAFTAAETQSLAAVEALVAAHAPSLRVPVDASLAEVVAVAKAHGVDFTAAENEALAKAEAAVSGRAPSLRAPVTRELQQLVAEAKTHGATFSTGLEADLLKVVAAASKHGKEFSVATDKAMLQAEQYLAAHHTPFTQAGADVVKGLLEGLQAEKPNVLHEADQIAADIEATLRNALKTRSPSLVTKQIGQDVAAGLAQGIDEGFRPYMTATGPLGTSSPVSAPQATQTIIVELDGKEITRTVQAGMLDNFKVVARME